MKKDDIKESITEIDTPSYNETEHRIKSAEALFGILSDDITLEEVKKEHMKKKFAEPNETTYAAFESAENNKDMYGPFDSIKELIKALTD